jgi:hypothetical protein
MSVSNSSKAFVWIEQTAIMSYQNPPTQNEWVTLLEVSGGVKVDIMEIMQNNTEAGAKNIEVRIYPNDEADKGFSTSIPAGGVIYCVGEQATVYGWTLLAVAAGPMPFGRYAYGGAAGDHQAVGGFWEGRSIKIQIRMTSAPGTSQYLTCRISYHKLEAI